MSTNMFGLAFITDEPTESSTSSVSTTVVQEEVTYRRPETRATDIGKAVEDWTWEDLRNYVVRRIEAVHGAFPRDPRKEKGIFSSFVSRHGQLAGAIAQFAFDVCDGIWKGSPISVTRFCKASDPYFADEIKARLLEPVPVRQQV